MLQSSENSHGVRSTSPASNPNSYNPVKTTTAPIEQATIGRSLVIKGEISGAEALYIDGRDRRQNHARLTIASPSAATAPCKPTSPPAKLWSWAR